MVTGIRCKNAHFNRPDALFCAVCGISMVHETHAPVRAPRPNLGHLVFDDGTVYQVDSDYVLGARPDTDPAVVAGDARPLVLADGANSVSGIHAAILLEEWDVRIEDRQSTNGTWLWDDSAGRWTQLPPGRPMTLKNGTHVSMGQRTFRFEPANHL